VALTDLFIQLVDQRCGGAGLRLLTPLDAASRGSQVSFRRHEGAYAIIQALIARGVVGDFREPGLMRFGFAPLYLRFIDVWDAVDHLAQVMWREEWRQPRFHRRAAVT
jgi:kynureninase